MARKAPLQAIQFSKYPSQFPSTSEVYGFKDALKQDKSDKADLRGAIAARNGK